jgi:CDP-diacylglycerol--glycerol-3-phosphate 3-phosphatidyltransferase
MNTPNKLTLTRILLTPVFLLLLCLSFPFHYFTAGMVFFVAAMTDFFDGKIARSRGLVTTLGQFLDPIADKMLTTAAFIYFLAAGRMSLWALMLLLAREFMVTSVRLMAAGNNTIIAASSWGKAKTVSQIVAIAFMLAALEFSTWQQSVLQRFIVPDVAFLIPLYVGEAFIWISVALSLISGMMYVWDHRMFLREPAAGK